MPGLDSNTLFCTNCDGVDASTTFIDKSSYARTLSRSAFEVDTAQSKFGGASGLYTTTSGYLSIPSSTDFDFGTGAFTIDLWLRAPGGDHQILISDGGEANWINFYFQPTVLGWRLQGDGGHTLSHSMSSGTWYHIAFERTGSTCYAYVNGTSIGNFSSSANLSRASYAVIWGRSPTTPYIGSRTDAWIDEPRISNVSRYGGSNFTPPTAAYDVDGQPTFGRRWDRKPGGAIYTPSYFR